MSLYLNRGCHAVLALLSERYPPLEGRSPTRYSPVRHSTQDRSPFRVRLACVRHAASVDSEPGSNSQVDFLREPLISSSQLLIYFCLVSPCITAEQLTLDGLVICSTSFPPHALQLGRSELGAKKALRVARSIQFSKNQGLTGFSAVFPPQMPHPISWMPLRPFFGGTFQTYDDSPCPVNLIFRL